MGFCALLVQFVSNGWKTEPLCPVLKWSAAREGVINDPVQKVPFNGSLALIHKGVIVLTKRPLM